MKPPSSRKVPRQERAKATVAAILEATGRILVESGYEALNTNAIAQRAGCSVGSLYEYFPNKESLLAALVDDHIESMERTLHGELARVLEEAPPQEVAVGKLVRAVFAMFRKGADLHRAILEQVPRVERQDRWAALTEHLAELSAAALESHAEDMAIKDYARAAALLTDAMEGVTRRCLFRAPERLADEVLMDDVTRMVVAYLRTPEKAR